MTAHTQNEVSAGFGGNGRSPRLITATYLLAMGFIAALALAGIVAVRQQIAQQALTFQRIRIVDRQRSMTQRIANVARGVADGSVDRTAGNDELARLADRMELTEQLQIDGDRATGLGALTAATQRHVYFENPVRLHEKLASYVAVARAFRATPAPTLADPNLQLMQTAAVSLPAALDAAIATFRAALDHDIRHLKHVLYTLAGILLITLGLEAFFVYRPLFRSQQLAMETLSSTSTVDNLTHILNRRATLERMRTELTRANRQGQSMCLLIADIDRIQNVNAIFGAEAGDLVLTHFAAIAAQNLRAGDSLGRLGGEEFALILPATELTGGMTVAERIRISFASTSAAVIPGGHRLTATASIGVLNTVDITLPEALEQLDELLLRAKSNGRNRVEGAMTPRKAPKGTAPGATIGVNVPIA